MTDRDPSSVNVPRDEWDALREAASVPNMEAMVIMTARALIDAVDGTCVCGHPERWHGVSGYLNCTGHFGRCECNTFNRRTPPVPVSDEAELWSDDGQIKCPTCGVARGWNEDGHLTRGIWTLNCVECGSFQIEIEDAHALTVSDEAEAHASDVPLRADHPAILHALKEGHENGWNAAGSALRDMADELERSRAECRHLNDRLDEAGEIIAGFRAARLAGKEQGNE